MPSGRKPPNPEPEVFFLDRGLGRHIVAKALREAGQIVVTMADVYPDGTDQHVGDDEWITRASDEGWIALTKDYAIIREHTATLAEGTLRVFALNNANLTGDVMAARYVAHLNRILKRARRSGPYIYVVAADGLELRWPRSD